MKNKLTPFQEEQMIHLCNKLLEYMYEPEYTDFNERHLSDIVGLKNFSQEYQDELNKSDHIFKYIYALEKLINQL
tara:strand:+ start:582 stop:806 length:225 start_codon:yes stop_codon:yes gene_type:complete